MDYDNKILESLSYIEKNLQEKISLESIAEKIYLSKYHYHRQFHKVTGQSVNEYIRKKRMEKAASELIETKERILDIAIKYQYDSQEAFTRAFKSIYNVTPGKYRKLYAKSISCNTGANITMRIKFSSFQRENLAA